MNSIIIGWNVIKRLVHQKLSFGFLVIFPVLAGLFIVLMMGKTSGTKQAIGFSNLDRGTLGIELIKFLETTDRFEIIDVGEKNMVTEIKKNDYSAGIIIPENYSESIEAKENTLVKMIQFRPSTTSEQLKETINIYIGGVYSGKQVSMETSNMEDKMSPITEQTRLYLGFLLIMVMLFMGTGIGMILEDKNEKTFMRTYTAPIREFEMVLGNVLANFIIGLFQVILYLLVTTILFQVDWGTSLINVMIISIAYLLSAVGIAVGLAGFVTDNQKYSMINFITIVPVSILGGAFFSVKLFPDSLQKVADFIPQSWAIEALEKLAAGEGLQSISLNIIVLLLFGIVFFTFGLKTLRITNEDL